MSDFAPGWYNDPVDPAVQRYWDGEGWLGEPVPADAPTPVNPPSGAPPATLDAPRPVSPPPPPRPEAGAPAVPSHPTQPGKPTQPGQPAVPVQPHPAPWGPPGAPLPQTGPPGAPMPPAGPLQPGMPVPPGAFPPGSQPPGAVQILLPTYQLVAPHKTVRPHGHAIASLGSRLLARLVDILVVLGLNVLVTGWFVYQWWNDMYPVLSESVRRSLAGQSANDLTPPERASSLEIVIILLIAALWFAYEVPSIAGRGQTLGKRLLGIKVMRIESQEPVGFRRAIRRWNPLGLPTLLWTCVGVGFLLQLLDSLSPTFDRPLRRAFHDRSAGTVVVRVERDAAPASTEDKGSHP